MAFNAEIFGGLTLAAGNPLEHVLSHPLTGPLFGTNIPFTNHQLMVIVAGILMVMVFIYVGSMSRKRPVPTGLQNFFETLLTFLRTEVFRPQLKEHADRFTPFLWTVFFFVLFCNLLGMFPLGEIMHLATGKEQHFWGTATGNFIVTGALAIIAFITVHVTGVVQQIRIAMDPHLDPHYHEHHHEGHGEETGKGFALAVPVGIGRYIWNFAPHPNTGMKFMDLGLFLLLLVLEFIGALVKPFSLCIRLFANMIAGHLVLGSLVSLVPFTAMSLALVLGVSLPVVLGCAALSLLELFVAFLQAYIFTFLTTLFISGAIAPEH